MRRSLTYFWRQHLLVAAGAAVASAVLTGALLVGDSVRGSLRSLALDRLGDTEVAMVSEGFFRSSLAPLLAAQEKFGEAGYSRAEPLLMFRGSAIQVQSRARASRINLIGVEETFGALFRADSEIAPWDFGDVSGVTAPVVLNRSLARELGAEAGSEILFSIPRSSEIPRASLLGRRDTGSVVQSLRLRVAAVVEDRGAGAFSLAANQGTPKNAFVPLARLQGALGQEGKANILLVANSQPSGPRRGVAGAQSSEKTAASLEALQRTLREVVTLEDFGLSLKSQQGHVTLESSRFILRDETVRVAEEVFRQRGAYPRPLLSYLANSVRKGSDSMPYAAVVALEPPDQAPPNQELPDQEPQSQEPYFQGLWLANGEPAPALGDGEIYLNGWAAEDLGANPGDQVDLEYYSVGAGEQLSTETATFQVRGVVSMEGLGADPLLTPEFPGMADAEDIAAWDPPFPVDLSTIRALDEEYWDLYRAAPKAFVAASAGQRLWRSRFGGATSLRVLPQEGQEAEELERSVATSLAGQLPLGAFGLTFQPVRSHLLEASGGATEFSSLFLGFSWFLIVAAVSLVALLFKFGVEQRAKEVGLLRAVGFSLRRVRRRFLGEGVVVAVVGALLGLLGAVLYGAAMMAGLRTWWLPAVGSRELTLFVESRSLLIGFLVAVVVTVLTILASLRRLGQISTTSLLAGSAALPGNSRSGRWARWVAWGAGVLALAALAVASRGGAGAGGLFIAAGAALLASGLGFFALWCRSTARSRLSLGTGALTRVALRNSARNPGRSILSVSLVACACYVIVVAAAHRRPAHQDSGTPDPGTGGFSLLAESDVPLFQDLATEAGQFELGLSAEAATLLDQGRAFPLRVLPGDDASCLNLFRVERPRVLGVPPAFVERGGFLFQQATEELENPWELLDRDLGRDSESGARIVPAVADFETATWILHKKLADDLDYVDESGQPLKIRLVGLLHASIFQSEVVVSQENLLRHFPSAQGFSSFLVEAPTETSGELAVALEKDLADFGFDVETTADRLAGFKAVQNTFLSTFQTLGGLGLLLGTLGLAVILLRNVLERRGELATLRAFGFRRSLIGRLVWVENLFLLAFGLCLGTGAALLSSAPYLLAGGSGLPWASLSWTLLGIFATGAIACAVATSTALKTSLVAALRG
ncbi:MAG: ABC transporter permease [Deltaproteobacteria bacterium]|nr:ABC transporter permease [Deltaproteobacteria bacterium]